MKIWLSDLTYTQQTISSDVVPVLTIGMLAEYLEASIDSKSWILNSLNILKI